MNDYKEIPLTQGYVAIVDPDDYDFLTQWKWHAVKGKTTVYARRGRWKGKAIYMHRVIMDAKDGEEIDHINRNGLDNRRENLRIADRTINTWNQGKRKNNTSGYHGVSKNKYGNWEARISSQGRSIVIGHFKTPEVAARAYDQKAYELRGKYAYLNFPNELEETA